MTCVIGLLDKGKIYMGADSAGVSNYDIRIRQDPKIYTLFDNKKNKMLIGFTSSFRMGQLLGFDFELPNRNDEEPDDMKYMIKKFIPAIRKLFKDAGYTNVKNNVENGGFFIVGYKNKLYEIESDFQVATHHDNYLSVGCGDCYAVGNLFATSKLKMKPIERIKSALECTEYFSAGVRRPFIIERIENDR